MCLPSSWDTLTREERLMEMSAVREHHRTIIAAIHNAPTRGARDEAIAAYDAHTAEHKAAAQRMRTQREK